MVLTVMRITDDLIGTVGIGLTGIGITVKTLVRDTLVNGANDHCANW
jgi:hypothetical protein